MAYSRPSSYPYPSSFKNIKDVEEYQKKLYASLMENDRNGEFYRDRATPADLKEMFFRPEWYGAKGDGVTDDYTAIQAAINAAHTSNGGTVYFSDKVYLIKTGLTIYGNTRYYGQGIAMYHGSGLSDRATVIKWGGGLTGTMITANDTWGTIWDGISLRGNLIESATSTVIGISVNATGTSGYSSQRNYFRNFSIYGCDYGIAIAKAYPASSNTDGWVIENFQMYYCNFGIYVGTQNAAYSVIRNGAIYPYDTGIHLYQCGYLKIESVFFGGEVGPTGDGAFIHIEPSTHTIIIENSQSEEASGITGFKFILFDGLVGKNYPTTLIGCVIDSPISVANTQISLILIGNAIENVITVSANDTYVYALGNVYTYTGTITDSGTNNHITKIEYLEASFSENITATGDINTADVYKIDGAEVVDQDVTSMSTPLFEAVYGSGVEEGLTDGGLENWTTATNLTSWAEYISGTSTINRESTEIHGGTYSCRMDIDASENPAYIEGDATMVANYPYGLTLWHNIPVGKSAMIIVSDSTYASYLQPDGTWAATFGADSLTGTGDWTEYSFGFISNPSYTAYKVQIQSATAASSSLYFDDVSVKKMLVFGGDNTIVNQDVTTTASPTFANPVVTTLNVGANQVVGARVVDARIDDTINSGDATTDGVIDAIRDALISHGLIAAA